MTDPTRVLVVGGGNVGMAAAMRLQKHLGKQLRRGAAEITVVAPDPYMTYQPFLAEAAAGSVQPRHVVVPLRRVLPRCRVVAGRVTSVDHPERTARVATLATDETGEPPLELAYDQLVMVPGSVSRVLPVPGLAEYGIGFTSIEEAIGLRNHVLEQLDIASSTRDAAVREAALTFVFVGGGYAGVEALAELEDMARYATRYYTGVRPADMRWVLVEASDRILPEVGERLGEYAVRRLRERGIDVRLETRLSSCTDRVAQLDDGAHFPTRTLVWTAGVRPNPVLAATGLPRDDRGRLRCTPDLRVEGEDAAWSAGDAAAVPDLTADEPGALCAPNAQHAVRQARVLADNLAAALRGAPLRDYRHRYAGSVASLGLHKGIAYVYGHRLKGYPAWLMHRAYHLGKLPTVGRKAHVLAEWTLSGLFKREIVALGSLEHPRAEFELATRSGRGPDGD
ncbi:FAD-dependent oxidoreductase [Streptomyces sp. NBC_01808]|uniref:NAD(P)/FAD-dependent oxidoreductase n=1 Tax=Streptomyces sp. NBC_01808 TaxID=2975947 RepID=UPI002DD7AF72|nr:FAD-dependent oxidoreductase [Streptomyces sp. NBC_01808]WSA39677.1 FAD-dependent oxidoreductase [Streptomyces sp. NBC_01808]